MKNYIRSIPFSENNKMNLNLNLKFESAISAFAFAQCAQRSERTVVPFCTWKQKLLSHCYSGGHEL